MIDINIYIPVSSLQHPTVCPAISPVGAFLRRRDVLCLSMDCLADGKPAFLTGPLKRVLNAVLSSGAATYGGREWPPLEAKKNNYGWLTYIFGGNIWNYRSPKDCSYQTIAHCGGFLLTHQDGSTGGVDG